MLERGILFDDIIHVVETMISIEWNDKHQTYNIDGFCENGEELTVAAAIENDVVIVTVF